MTIKNMNDITPVIVSELLKSSFDFYITGSRFWGNLNALSDWDFFVQESQEVTSYLMHMGFTTDPHHQYDDPLTVEVMKRGLIHVQIVHDAALKHVIQQTLFKYFPEGMIPSYWADCPKKFATIMWDLAFDLLNLRVKHSQNVVQFPQKEEILLQQTG